MRPHEQFYTSGYGAMIDGDDDARLHHRHDLHGIIDQDDEHHEPAEVHFADSSEYDSTGNVTALRGRDGSKLGWAPLADDGKPGDGISDDAPRRTPLPKSNIGNGILTEQT